MTLETVELAPGYRVTRLIRGCWQLAGAHGPVDRERAIADQVAAAEAGITAFDCADVYTGVEQLLGDFLAAYGAKHGRDAAARIRIHTKFIPAADLLARITRADVVAVIDRSLARLKRERLDLVQFHWWNYAVPRAAETALWLKELQQAGKIAVLGATNFNSAQLAVIVDAGVPIAAHQVQYSLLDGRAAGPMSALCARTGMKLLCYGTLAGGMLAERWLGAPEPRADQLTTRSLVKYKDVIDEIGGWALFQEILSVVHCIAQRYGVSIANVATRAMLDQPHVAGVIVGATSGDRHLADNIKLTQLRLDDADHAALGAVLDKRRGPPGDIWDLERDPKGRHGFAGKPYTQTLKDLGQRRG
jgi:aryl-alcohol dehydrogenase-like predicted oxidoreductase